MENRPPSPTFTCACVGHWRLRSRQACPCPGEACVSPTTRLACGGLQARCVSLYCVSWESGSWIRSSAAPFQGAYCRRRVPVNYSLGNTENCMRIHSTSGFGLRQTWARVCLCSDPVWLGGSPVPQFPLLSRGDSKKKHSDWLR